MFMHDWVSTYTPEQAEKALSKFEWKGTGWYVTKTDTLLVLESPLEGYYSFWCWNRPDARKSVVKIMKQILTAPVFKKEKGDSSGL